VAEVRTETSHFTLISVGRIAPVKRLEIIIAAVKALREQGLTDVRLILVARWLHQTLIMANGCESWWWIIGFPMR